jgi:hypothetical protein
VNETDDSSLTDGQAEVDTLLVLRDAIARAYDAEAFEEHSIEERSTIAAIQWGARRHLALQAADRLLPWLAAHDVEVTERTINWLEAHDGVSSDTMRLYSLARGCLLPKPQSGASGGAS